MRLRFAGRMLRSGSAFGARRTHQESRHPVRPVQFVGRSVQEEARPTAKEPGDRSMEWLCGWVHRWFPAGHIYQFQIAQAIAVVGTVATVGRCGSTHPDHAGKTHRDVKKERRYTIFICVSYYCNGIVVSYCATPIHAVLIDSYFHPIFEGWGCFDSSWGSEPRRGSRSNIWGWEGTNFFAMQLQYTLICS